MRYVESYVHKSSIGVLVEIEADSDSAIGTDEFRQLARDLVLHIASGKPTSVAELLDQPFIKAADQKVSHRLYVVSTLLNTPVRITRFVRYDTNAA
jgi:translation elongation factor EF-Ts